MKHWFFKDVIVIRNQQAMYRPLFITLMPPWNPRSTFTFWWNWRSTTSKAPSPMRRMCSSRAARLCLWIIRGRNRRLLCIICSLQDCSHSTRIMRSRLGLRRKLYRTWRNCFNGAKDIRDWQMIETSHNIIV